MHKCDWIDIFLITPHWRIDVCELEFSNDCTTDQLVLFIELPFEETLIWIQIVINSSPIQYTRANEKEKSPFQYSTLFSELVEKISVRLENVSVFGIYSIKIHHWPTRSSTGTRRPNGQTLWAEWMRMHKMHISTTELNLQFNTQANGLNTATKSHGLYLFLRIYILIQLPSQMSSKSFQRLTQLSQHMFAQLLVMKRTLGSVISHYAVALPRNVLQLALVLSLWLTLHSFVGHEC